MLNKTDNLYLVQSTIAAKLSSDPSTKVGAVLILKGVVVFTGCNTFLTDLDPSTATREERYACVIHAEAGVLLRVGKRARGGTLYASEEPCRECYKAASYLGVSRIVHYETDDERRARWGCEDGKAIATMSGITVIGVPRNEP